MNAPTVLLYEMDPDRARKIKLLCLPMKLRARTVAPEEYGLSLKALLDGEKLEPGGEVRPLGDEMMVMANLTVAQMNRLLAGFRRSKLPPVNLKAVLTAVNAEWDAYRLHSELKAEHEAMARGETAHPKG